MLEPDDCPTGPVKLYDDWPVEPAPAPSESPMGRGRRLGRAIMTAVATLVLLTSAIVLACIFTGETSLFNRLGFHANDSSTTEVQAPSLTPVAPTTSAAPTIALPTPSSTTPTPSTRRDPVAAGMPSYVTLRHNGQDILSCGVDGVYQPVDGNVYPPGAGAYLMNPDTTSFSRVGDDQGTAILIARGVVGDASTCFASLRDAAIGDTVQVTVPGGVVAFSVDDIIFPSTGTWEPDASDTGVLYLVASKDNGRLAVIVQAHIVPF